MKRRLALTKDGKITWCTAPEDKIGFGRCDHVFYQKINEDNNQFIKRCENNQKYIEEHSKITDNDSIEIFKDDLGFFSYLTYEDINAGDYSRKIGGSQPKTVSKDAKYIKFDNEEADSNGKINYAFSYPSITETVCSSLIRNSDIFTRIRCANYHLGVYIDKNNSLNDSKTFSISESFIGAREEEYRLASAYGANKMHNTLMKTEDYRSEIFETLKINESKNIIINNIINSFSNCNINIERLNKQFDDKCAIDILFGNRDIRNNPGNFIVSYNNDDVENKVNIISMDYGRCLHFGESNTYMSYDDFKDFEPFKINIKEMKKECNQIKLRLRDENLRSFFNSSIEKLISNLNKYPNLWMDVSE